MEETNVSSVSLPKQRIAVVYARYSSNNQTEQSIEGQVHVCEDFAKRNNMIIVDYYIDRAISGTTDERDAFQKMIKDSNMKKWNCVLVYKLDRFSRDKYESAVYRRHLKNNGVDLISAMENIPQTPEGLLMEAVLEGMNDYFSKELAQKVRRGLHESRMKGHIIGSVPFGYIKENKMLKTNEDEAKIIKQIYEEYLSGKTILQISRDFEKNNITMKGKRFYPETIRNILQREWYTGIYKINDKVYDKIYPQIITKETFDKVQARMNLTRYGCRKDNHEIFKIKDKIYCGHCNRKMYPFSTKSRNGNYLRYYKCISGKKNNCSTRITEKNFIEGVVDKFFKQQFTIPENLNAITDLIYEENKKRTKRNSSLSNMKSEMQRINTSISNILTAIEKGIITETTKSRLEELEQQRNDLQEKLIIEESKITYELTKEDIQNFFRLTLKNYPEKAIDLFLKFVNIYEDKIEIGLKYSVNQNNVEYTPITTYTFTETLEITRAFKGGTTRTKTLTYDVYSVI